MIEASIIALNKISEVINEKIDSYEYQDVAILINERLLLLEKIAVLNFSSAEEKNQWYTYLLKLNDENRIYLNNIKKYSDILRKSISNADQMKLYINKSI